MLAELDLDLVAVDHSPRMVELARERGVDARVGDAQELDFDDGRFECVVANWMLYHVDDLDLALAEFARVLVPGGRLVAATIGDRNMHDVWSLTRLRPRPLRQFSKENGEEALRRHFARVERVDVDAILVFPDVASIRDYIDVDLFQRCRPATLARARRAVSRQNRECRLRRGESRVIRPAELIQRKRDGGELTSEELNELMLGYARDEVPDYQMAALCMAIFFRGLTSAETYAMTDAMIATGDTVDLGSALGRKVVDKHSTGGVGDKTSIAVGPIVAACGVPFGKMSGRGLGHTGGTLDKLESIPGFRVELYDRGVRRAGAGGRDGDHRRRARTSFRPTRSSTRCAT